MSRLRVSAIGFLNTAPLLWDFEHGPRDVILGNNFDVHYSSPSECADELKKGASDIGIIPVAAYSAIADLRVIPGIAIAARGAVRSILLVCKKPIEQVRTVALDVSSRTSVILTRILFAIRWKTTPEFRSHLPALDEMLAAHDAALLIGDPALLVQCGKFEVFDLAEEWKRQTDLPFVFAFWAVREDAVRRLSEDSIVSAFRNSRDNGLANLDRIVSEWRSRIDLPASAIREYLTSNVYYFLGPNELEGLRLFYRYAAEIMALPECGPIKFLDSPVILEGWASKAF